MKRIILLSVCLLIAVTLLFAGGEQEITSSEDTKSEDTMVDVIRLGGGDWGYPTPYAHYPRGPGGFKMCLIFDSLLERDEDGLIPWLAEDYQIKNEGKQYLFTMRKGITWHDGKPLTVEDVKFSFEYASKHPMVWSYVGSDDVERVEIKDDYQILITVKNPDASLLYNIGRVRILPKHIWEKVEVPKEYNEPDAVIGSGPYKLSDYSKEHGTYRFEAFEDFWGPKQRIQFIEFIPVSESVLAFEKEEIDLTRISPDLLGRYENKSEYKVVQRPAFWGYRLLFNMGDNQVLQHKDVRQAINYAIDKNELIEKIARGAGVPGSGGILPPDHVFYNPEVKQYEYNHQKARNLLEKAGYGSLSLTLKVPDREIRLAELIKNQLEKVNIELTIISSDRKTHDSRVRNMEYELAILGHGGWGGEPDYLRRFVGESASTGSISPLDSALKGYNNSKLNSLLLKQKHEFDRGKRKQILFEIQNVLAEDVPEIPLYYTAGYTVYRPEKYDGWIYMFDHHSLTHSKLSYLEKK